MFIKPMTIKTKALGPCHQEVAHRHLNSLTKTQVLANIFAPEDIQY